MKDQVYASRVKGPTDILGQLRRVLHIGLSRYVGQRARTPEQVAWGQTTFDALKELIVEAERTKPYTPPDTTRPVRKRTKPGALFAIAAITLLAPLQASDWVSIVAAMPKKVLRVEIRGEDKKVGVCSAVVYRIDPDKRAYALTASHCVEHPKAEAVDLTVNDHHAEVVMSNALLDLAVITFKARNEEAINLAPDPPPMGTEIAALGYAFAVEDLAAQFGHVAQAKSRNRKELWVDVVIIGGDSGGCVVDGQGRLVGLSTGFYTDRSQNMGVAVPIDAISDFLDAVEHQLEKQAKKN